MATYAIGDVQGCFDELGDLLSKINYRPDRDKLWFAGDLVNRGPRSVDVLRFVKACGDGAITVLGNHDLHLVAAAYGVRELRRADTFADVLQASDRDELLDWLCTQPVLHYDQALDFAMVHAGIPPAWGLADALSFAGELHAVLASPEREVFFHNMYGDKPLAWEASLQGWSRLRFITNAFTRMRFVTPDGSLSHAESGTPEQHAELQPWFAVAHENRPRTIFGHWATLRLTTSIDPAHGVFHLDTGCVWGGRLTALRLEDVAYIDVPSRQNSEKL